MPTSIALAPAGSSNIGKKIGNTAVLDRLQPLSCNDQRPTNGSFNKPINHQRLARLSSTFSYTLPRRHSLRTPGLQRISRSLPGDLWIIRDSMT